MVLRVLSTSRLEENRRNIGVGVRFSSILTFSVLSPRLCTQQKGRLKKSTENVNISIYRDREHLFPSTALTLEAGKSPTEAGTRNGKAASHGPCHHPPRSSMSAILDIVESDSLSLLKTRVLSSRRGPRAPADPPEKLNSECNYTV
jgi:hypothetical protein